MSGDAVAGPRHGLRQRPLKRALATLALTGVVPAVAVLAAASPAAASPGASLVVSGAKPSVGQVRFLLSASGLADPADLTPENLAVAVDGTTLTSRIESAKDTPRAELPTRGAMLAIDTSAAMSGAPLAAAKAAAGSYADALPSDVAVGLVAFSDTARVVAQPTYDRGQFRSAVETLTAGGGGALVDGVRKAADAFGDGYVQHRVVLVAAAPDTRSVTTVEQAKAAVRGEGTVVDLIGYGKTAPSAEVSALAEESGGRAIAAPDAAGLKTELTGLAKRFSEPVVVTATVPAALSGRAATVNVTVYAGGAAAGGEVSGTVAFPITFAVDPAATSQLKTVAPRVLPTTILFGALGVIALAFAILGFVGVYQLLGRSNVRRRLREIDRFTGDQANRPAQAPETRDGNPVMRAALSLSERAVRRRGSGRIEQELERAGLALRPAEWILARAVATIIATGIMIVLLPWFLGLVVGAVGGWIGSGKYLKFRANRRAQRFGDLLPEALQLVVGALRSGFSLMQAIDAVVREGPEPVASEFGRAMAEIRLGGEIEDALERTAQRNGSEDLGWLVMAIRIQREVGGNLSEVLETAVDTMRERGRLARHVRALSAEGRLSAYVLIGMPIVLALFLFVFRGEYLRPMYTTVLGVVMLLGAGLLLATGAFVISRMVKVKV